MTSSARADAEYDQVHFQFKEVCTKRLLIYFPRSFTTTLLASSFKTSLEFPRLELGLYDDGYGYWYRCERH